MRDRFFKSILGLSATFFIIGALLVVSPRAVAQSDDELFGGDVLADNEDEGTNGGGSDNEDDLFGGDVVTGDDGGDSAGGASAGGASADGDSESAADALLSSEETRIGGSYSFSFRPRVVWSELGDLSDVEIDGYENSFGFDLGAQVFLDARPSDDFRVYAEADIGYPFTLGESDDGLDGQDASSRDFDDVVRITELFSDFQIGDSLFLRGGKHTVTWGVGYFFSPADIINLERIDPENPEADREGPVNLRVQYPFSANNVYLYLLPPVGSQEFPAVAPKLELVLGLFELGFGGFWRYDSAPAGMFTLDGTLWELDVFGEAVVLGENDRRYIREVTVSPEAPLGLEVYTRDEPTFQATLGAGYSYSDVEGRINLNAFAQYFYNGEGYEDADLLRENRAGIGALLADGELSSADLTRPGRHYGAVSLSLRNILSSDFSLSGLWYANLSDASGQLSQTLSYRFTDRLSVSGSARWLYGPEEPAGAEFTPLGEQLELNLSLSFGSGRF